MKKTSRFIFMLAAMVALAGAPTARAWGCKGHQIVALIAEANLTSRARATAFRILADGPIDPSLPRYCGSNPSDAFEDASTWADDERSVQPDTAAWHFVDIPRGAPQGDIAPYCPPATGCVTAALADQLRVLRNGNAPARARADALRFVIHFVADAHQPMHTITNNDRGGNCVPVAFFNRSPRETNSRNSDYTPNLHEIWDVEIIEGLWPGNTPEQIARALNEKYSTHIGAWESAPPDFVAWAWETRKLAETTAYGRLPHAISVETPRPVQTCSDDNQISSRLLRLDERLGDDYERSAAPVIEEQLTKAGIRLAALLNSLWP